MSAVIATPELMAQAATDLASIGSTVNAAHMTAAPPTLSVLPAAADEVSARIAHLFSGYAQKYQGLAGKAAAFQEQFVQHLTAGAVSYASAEAVNVASLLKPLTAVATPVAAAATAAQSTLNDLMTNLVTNIQIFLNTAIATLFVSIFVSWLIADLAALFLGLTVVNIITSSPLFSLASPWFSLAMNALIEATYPIFTTFPILGELVSAVTSVIEAGALILFLPLILIAAVAAIGPI
jgi:hypothetical protein